MKSYSESYEEGEEPNIDEFMERFEENCREQEIANAKKHKEGWLAILVDNKGFRREITVEHPPPPRIFIPVPSPISGMVNPSPLEILNRSIDFRLEGVDEERSIARYQEMP